MDLLGGSVEMNVEPDWTVTSGLLNIHSPDEQVTIPLF